MLFLRKFEYTQAFYREYTHVLFQVQGINPGFLKGINPGFLKRINPGFLQ